MKTLLTIFTLVFTVMFSSTSFAEWTRILGENARGHTYYVDFDRIRKHDGYVYYWVLADSLKPVNGDLSAVIYYKGDCKLFRVKYLSISNHKEPMGRGTGNTPPVFKEQKEWTYPHPNSGMENILKKVCSR